MRFTEVLEDKWKVHEETINLKCLKHLNLVVVSLAQFGLFNFDSSWSISSCTPNVFFMHPICFICASHSLIEMTSLSLLKNLIKNVKSLHLPLLLVCSTSSTFHYPNSKILGSIREVGVFNPTILKENVIITYYYEGKHPQWSRASKCIVCSRILIVKLSHLKNKSTKVMEHYGLHKPKYNFHYKLSFKFLFSKCNPSSHYG